MRNAIFQKVYLRHSLEIRYLCIGAINTIVGITCFPIAYYIFSFAQHHYMFLLIICQIFSITFSYLTNKFYVFQTKGQHFLEYLRFTSFYNFFFIINLLFLPLLISIWHLNPAKIQLAISAVASISGYFWHRYISFKI